MRFFFLAALFVLVALPAPAQRSAGTFDPRETRAGTLQFSPNPDGGGDCVQASGAILTDAGLVVGVGTSPVCPRTAAQASRVAACENMAISVINNYAALADGGI